MSKQQKSTSTVDVDPRTQGIRNEVYGAAERAAGITGELPPGWRMQQESGGITPFGGRLPGRAVYIGPNGERTTTRPPGAPGTAPGLSPLTQGAQDFSTQALAGGQLGLRALSGDQAAASQLMNPYQQQVIDALGTEWMKRNQQTTAGLNDQATLAGAFGGSRHGVAQGVALANNAQAQQQQIAGLLSSGFESAMGRAGGLANLGLSGTAGAPGLNDYLRTQTDPDLYRISVLQNAMRGVPTGQVNTQTQQTNPFSSGLGLLSIAGGLGWQPFK